jgi:hypothetical protein
MAMGRTTLRRSGHQLDQQLNELFASYHNAELAHLKGDTHQFQSIIAHGLAQSCALMRELRDIDALNSVTPSHEILLLLGDRVRVERFVLIERELLQKTKTDQHVIDYLIGALEFLLTSKPELPDSWRNDLELFIDKVCGAASNAAMALRPPSLLMRAIVAGGGGLIAMLNLAPPIPGLWLPPELAPLSATAGVWLISEAAKDQLKAFMNR